MSILRICTFWRTGATARLLLIALRALHRRRWRDCAAPSHRAARSASSPLARLRGSFSSRCALCIVAAGATARLLLIALRALHRRRWRDCAAPSHRAARSASSPR
ncbi:hypothetical protein I552_2609 [Mycobacterium xenopi 3993]|nr:hypothetical protein I552_2609 [Mycobacterium xenopi 3993]